MRDDSIAFTGQGIPAATLARLGRTRGFVFDMDGTLLLGNERNHDMKPLPGALEITHWLSAHGIPFAVFTNGTARSPEEYATTLRKLGFALPDAAMMTPASSAVDLFVQRGYKRVLVLGGDGLAMPLRKAGIEVVAPVGRPQADAVLIGWYREFTMNNLEAACYAVWGGAQAFSASQALFFATAAGKTLEKGTYRVTFMTGDWFATQKASTFFPEVPVIFEADGSVEHYHIPLLLSPYGFSTYRGN